MEKLGSLADPVQEHLQRLEKDRVLERIFRNDPTLWKSEPEHQTEIQTRLGWRDLPILSQVAIPEIQAFVEACKNERFTKALVLGMGGSSLAPETMSLILGDQSEGLELKIIDSTVPAQISEVEKWIDYSKTLFILSSKSGTTSEPLALFAYFCEMAEKVLGKTWVAHFIAITDPGSYLAKLGKRLGFRAVFTADPNVGGRYSALTHFGLVPAALIGIDIHEFLIRAQKMAERCLPTTSIRNNPGALLGVIMGVGAIQGKDKLTLLTDENIAPIGAWLEQLIAESSGKEGWGILPVVDEPKIGAADYAQDRLFVYLRSSGSQDDFITALEEVEQPALVLQWDGLYDLAAQMYCWEFATAIACSLMKVNAFDQPDVQDSKERTKQKLTAVKNKHVLEEPDPLWEEKGVKIFGLPFAGLDTCESLLAVIVAFTEQAESGDYIAINAYLPRNTDNETRLTALRKALLARTGCATTLGFGPRFLHSTGQLHKGGTKHGLFIQITQDDAADLEIPGEMYSFGTLARAQALGDLEALQARNRRVIRIHLPSEHALEFV